MKEQKKYRHWRLERDSDQILWLTLDRQDTSVNSLNREIFTELDEILAEVESNLPDGLVILSGKTKGFVAGADIKQFLQIKTEQEAFDLVRQAQIILDRLAQLPIPTVAMIRGFALGGGLELCLACTYRIAADTIDTVLGLPEVNLGLHPGFGGTVRLPLLVGAPKAMEIMLGGKPLSARKAAKIGLVDIVVPEWDLKRAAADYIKKQPPKKQPKGFACWSNAGWVRPWLGRWIEKKLAKKVNPEHYPAPFAIVKNWMRFGVQDESAYQKEARSIAKLMTGSVSRELVRVFFFQDQLKSLSKNVSFDGRRVHVIGAGTMGGDIAALCAASGFSVTLQDKTPEQIAPAIRRAHTYFLKKWEEERLVKAALDRFQPDAAGCGLPHADVLIEAIFEDLSVKQNLFKTVLPRLKPETIIATNTSSILLQKIAAALPDSARCIGLHFFNPATKMRLVEIVHTEQTSEALLKKAAAFVTRLGHYPLPVKSSPGFLVNRILMPYLLEAMILYEEGVSVAAIDAAAKNFGMPMGPIALADQVGLDICLSVARHLAPYYEFVTPEILTKKVERGDLGVKSGRGFYPYPGGGGRSAAGSADITDRLILRLCNEAVACWSEKIVANTDLLDAGMIYGIGFAPFRGGPMTYIRTEGAKNLEEKLARLAERYGERFKPHPQWKSIMEHVT